MRKILIAVCLYSGVASAQVTNWDNSPMNFKNSDMNWNNSSSNFKNSPYNWETSEYNFNTKAGVYDNSGNRLGYETMNKDGVLNYYDNSGNRTAYGR
jgi:hypothetical protein